MLKNVCARPLMAAFAVTVVACGTTTDNGKPDASNSCPTVMCGTTCCAAGQVCNAATNQCQGCVPDCAVKGKQCGSDGCGGICGSCTSPEVCDADGKCCQKESDLQMCQRLGRQCGPLSAPDNCGQPRTIAECGPCEGAKTCSASGTCSACTGNCDNKVCGDDGCGGTCGDCAAATTCSATGRACVSCTPNCGNKVCGTDANGCSCGVCAEGSACNASGQCTQCTPQSDTSFCADQRVACGSASGTDNCGRPRTVANCGGCPGTQQCVGGQCISCTPDTETQLCAKAGRQCGAFETTDNCNAHRSITSCGSCGGAQRCSAAGTCVATSVTCNGVTCAPGQGCFNPTTGSASGTGRKCTCLPQNFDPQQVGATNEDTCASEGMICDMDESAPAASGCRLPGWFELCQANPGCGNGLQCVTTATNEFPYTGKSYCFESCNSATDCPRPDTTCRLGACRYNICADPIVVPAGSTATAERAKYFQSCSTGAGTGTCKPAAFWVTTASGLMLQDRGLCQQNGTAARGAPCDPDAQRPNLSGMCPAGQTCHWQYYDSSAIGHGICRDACDVKNYAGTGCGTSGLCVSIYGSLDPYDAMTSSPGMCLTRCNALQSSTACNGTDVLGDSQGCYPYWEGGFLDGTGYCRATMPGASSAGGQCSLGPSGEARNECASGMACLNTGTTFGECVGWCNAVSCPSETASCSGCKPSGSACHPVDSGPLGYCY